MKDDSDYNNYSEAETEARREATLAKLLSTPPKPHKPVDKKSRRDSKVPTAPKRSKKSG